MATTVQRGGIPQRFGDAKAMDTGKDEKPLSEVEVSVMVRYETKTGEMLEGAFTIRAPSLADKAAMARAKARYSGGLPWQAFGPADQVLIDALARCECLIVDSPEWFKTRGLDKLDSELAVALGAKCLEHEESFFRGDPGKDQGQARGCFVEILPIDGV